MKKQLLYCGIYSVLLYVGMNIWIPQLYEGYSIIDQTVSELSAIGTPTRMLWVVWGVVYSVLAIAFAVGVLQSALGDRCIRLIGFFLLAYGIVSLFWPFAPMHQREALAQGYSSMSDTMHLTLASVTVVLMLFAIGFGAARFGKQFRNYSILTIVILSVFGMLTAIDAPKVQANLATPNAGIWERINIAVFLAWQIVLTFILNKRINQDNE